MKNVQCNSRENFQKTQNKNRNVSLYWNHHNRMAIFQIYKNKHHIRVGWTFFKECMDQLLNFNSSNV